MGTGRPRSTSGTVRGWRWRKRNQKGGFDREGIQENLCSMQPRLRTDCKEDVYVWEVRMV